MFGISCEGGCSLSAEKVDPFRPRKLLIDFVESQAEWLIEEELTVTQEDLTVTLTPEELGSELPGPITELSVFAGIPLGLPAATAALSSLPFEFDLDGDDLWLTSEGARVPVSGEATGVATLTVPIPFFGDVTQNVRFFARVQAEVDVQAEVTLHGVEIVELGSDRFGVARGTNISVSTRLELLDLDLLDVSIEIPGASFASRALEVAAAAMLGSSITTGFVSAALQSRVDAAATLAGSKVAALLREQVERTVVHLPGAGPACALLGPCTGLVGVVVDRSITRLYVLLVCWVLALVGVLGSPYCCWHGGCCRRCGGASACPGGNTGTDVQLASVRAGASKPSRWDPRSELDHSVV